MGLGYSGREDGKSYPANKKTGPELMDEAMDYLLKKYGPSTPGSRRICPAVVRAHERGAGACYTRGRGPFVIHSEIIGTKTEALKREKEIKGLRRADKLKLAVAWQNGWVGRRHVGSSGEKASARKNASPPHDG